MSNVDPAFKGAGQKVGMEVWRIEKLKVVQVSQKNIGSFFSGDSYIVLHTAQKPGMSSFEWDVHFWLGRETSQDESGIAAYKTVELDDSLGGAPVQHREVQGHESKKFLSYFKKGIKILDGGVDSGFTKVDREKFQVRLFHLKGKRQVRVNQVKRTFASLNEGDVFVLDAGRKIFQWNGKDASRTEKAKGLEVTRKIRDEERGGKAHIIVIEQGKDDDTDFFNELGDKGAIKSAKEGGEDSAFERSKMSAVKLYRVSDASGKLKVEEVGSAPLKKEMLDTNDCFILDQGGSALFSWIGKKATKEERAGAMKTATNFIKEKGYEDWIPCTRVVEGGETPAFKAIFSSWSAGKFSVNTGYVRGNIAKTQQKAVDVKGLHTSEGRSKQKMVDDGSGKLEVWRIENFDMQPVPKDQYGQFYAGDSYVLLYTYQVNGKENWLIYYWQGNKSSTDEKGTSALKATELDDKYGGFPVQVRVCQNKEPDHFLSLFKGRMIIHEGGKGSGFKNADGKTGEDSYDTDGTRLFHIKGTSELNTRAVQVAEVAASLNSNDAFVLETPGGAYVWCGKGCNGDEREVAKNVAKVVTKKAADLIMEGSEPAAFWEAIGGKGDYQTSTAAVDTEAADPRLFQCSNASGSFSVEECFDFAQEDLITDDVMLLDCGTEVFVWIGRGANDTEKKEALKTAVQYVKTDPSGRSEDTPIFSVKEGYEPPNFTCNFIAWDYEHSNKAKDSYEKLKGDIAGENAGVQLASVELEKFSKTYPLAELQKEPENLPEGVDAGNREQHLNDDDFKATFGMDRDAYNAMPAWKRVNEKKKHGLF